MSNNKCIFRSHAGEFYICQLRDESAAVSLLLQLFTGWQVGGNFPEHSPICSTCVLLP